MHNFSRDAAILKVQVKVIFKNYILEVLNTHAHVHRQSMLSKHFNKFLLYWIVLRNEIRPDEKLVSNCATSQRNKKKESCNFYSHFGRPHKTRLKFKKYITK